jgi:hypothetical protein
VRLKQYSENAKELEIQPINENKTNNHTKRNKEINIKLEANIK